MSVGLSSTTLQQIENHLVSSGYIVLHQHIACAFIQQLAHHIHALSQSKQLQSAQIGKQNNHIFNSEIRGDNTRWLESQSDNLHEQIYLGMMDQLRQHLNQTLFLGLQDFECHYALYPIGARYQKHLDQFKDDDLRQISAILYLNQDWKTEDGGALRLYLTENETPFLDVWPEAGTLVIFLSERFYHEVLPAKRERISITGWLRRKAHYTL